MAKGPIPDKPAGRPKTQDMLALARAFYGMPGHSVGGALHIVLDDGNLEEHHIRWCLEQAKAGGCHCGLARCSYAIVLADLLLKMTGTQRRKLYRQL